MLTSMCSVSCSKDNGLSILLLLDKLCAPSPKLEMPLVCHLRRVSASSLYIRTQVILSRQRQWKPGLEETSCPEDQVRVSGGPGWRRRQCRIERHQQSCEVTCIGAAG